MVKKNKKEPKKEQTIAHWSDYFTDQLIQMKGDKKEYVLEAGITPSGVVHAGNFREVITADLIRRALEKRGKKVRFLYIWDDYDVLRKVPKNLPKQDLIEKNLRKPVFKVPDVFGCHQSYAKHFEKIFEQEMELMGIKAEFVYQQKEYQACKYAEEIKIALEKTEKIKEILNRFRAEELTEDWFPIFVFCEKCDKDTLKELKWKGGYSLSYRCECGHEDTFDFRKKGIVTLRWRVDWPMRWHKNKVDFESAGKDHFAAGGSIDTARVIQKEIYGTEPPFGFPYEWISLKGGKQIHSSTGNVVTVTELLEVYEPEIVRYLYAGTRPNREFSLSFDADVINIYEAFDKAERIYFGLEKVDEKEEEKSKVAYELSYLGKIPKNIPYQPGFRHLTTLLQLYNLEVGKVIDYFEKELKKEHDKKRLRLRAECAKNWLQKYAPGEFRFTVQERCQVTLGKEERKILRELAKRLKEKKWNEIELHEEFYVLCTNYNFPVKEFFKTAYRVLINKERGPRLASFILEIGKEKVAELFEKA